VRGSATVRVLVLQPTSFCNIDCSYCYVPDRTISHRMKDDVLAGIASNILLPEITGESVLVCWHSGEPLTLPPSYYRAAINLLAKHRLPSLRMDQHFQTNGTLITPQWVEFFHEVKARICVSLDGPKELHDRSRIQRNGKGTHDATMRGIKLLRAGGVRPAVICVLTDYSLRHPQLLFDFFERNEFESIAFNVEETVGCNLSAGGTEETFSKFLDSYLTFAARQGSRQQLRDVESIAARLFQAEPARRFESLILPFAHVSVDVRGNYWTYSPELGLGQNAENFFLGNCRFDRITDAAETHRFLDLRTQVEKGVRLCESNCNYFGICGGGSPAHKYSELGRFDATETHFCRINVKAVADVLTAQMLGHLHEEAEH
jgi:uncharacterized protein